MLERLGRPWEGVKTDCELGYHSANSISLQQRSRGYWRGDLIREKSLKGLSLLPVSGYGSITVLVTMANIPPSLLIAQPNGIIPCIHRDSVAVCHSWSLSVSGVLGRSSDPRVGGSSPSGRTNE